MNRFYGELGFNDSVYGCFDKTETNIHIKYQDTAWRSGPGLSFNANKFNSIFNGATNQPSSLKVVNVCRI